MGDKNSTVQTAEEKAKEALFAAAEAKAKEENAKRSGKGTRVAVGKTRGKGSQIISYEEFDESLPDTHPVSFQEFADLTKSASEAEIVKFAVLGFNAENYKTASDPIAEFVNPQWPVDVQTQFRIVVRNYAKATNSSIESAVDILKPGIEAAYQKSKQG
jgi:hypothetical protein